MSSSPAPASLGGGSATEIVFYLNGKKVVEPHLEPDLSLIQYLRTGALRRLCVVSDIARRTKHFLLAIFSRVPCAERATTEICITVSSSRSR